MKGHDDENGKLFLNESLAEHETARRLHAASEGIVAYLMELVRRATYLAVTQGSERLDGLLLAMAFEQRLAGARRGIANPFTDSGRA